MSVQRRRLSATANNIANVNTTKAEDGQPYKREVVVVHGIEKKPFQSELEGRIEMIRTSPGHTGIASGRTREVDNTALEATSARDNTPPRMVYDPSHPDADEEGYVMMPNINIVTEMVEMISAQRAFEANAQVVESAKNIARESLDI